MRTGCCPSVDSSEDLFIVRRLSCWKVGLRTPAVRRGAFEAFAEALAYFDRGGGVVRVEESLWITSPHPAMSSKRMPIFVEGGLSDIVIASMAPATEDSSVS